MKSFFNFLLFIFVFLLTITSGFYFFLIEPNVIVKSGTFTEQRCSVNYIYPDIEFLNNKGIQKNIINIDNSCEKLNYGEFITNFSKDAEMAYYIKIPASLKNDLLKQHVFYFKNKNINFINNSIKETLIDYDSEKYKKEYLTSFDYNLPSFINNYVNHNKFKDFSNLNVKEIFVIVSVLNNYDIRISIFYDNSFEDNTIYNSKVKKFDLEKQIKVK